MCVLCMYRVSELGIISYSVLYTENVARGGKLSFQSVHGRGEGVYDILTFQKSRGGGGAWIAALYKTAHFQEVRAHGGISMVHGMPR